MRAVNAILSGTSSGAALRLFFDVVSGLKHPDLAHQV
jgi:hypothetical protein